MLEVRIRTCHVHGSFVAKNNKKPSFTLREALENPVRDVNRIVLPPASYMQEKDKHERRWPAAIEFIKAHRLNETFGPEQGDVGVVMLGGMYNSTMRALQYLGLADAYGELAVPLYVLNVAYPLVEDEIAAFCLGKRAVLMVEEGAPDFIERDLNTILRRRDLQAKVSGKDVLPMGGEYTAPVLMKGLREFFATHARELLGNEPPRPDADAVLADPRVKALSTVVPQRPPGFCIGCPERPIFAAMKLVEQELGPASHLRRYRLPPLFDPAALQHRVDDDGLRPRPRIGLGLQRALREALDFRDGRRRLLAQWPGVLDRQRRVQQA